MIKDSEHFRRFEQGLIKGQKADYQNGLLILDSMIEEAVCLKKFPPQDPLDGIETALRIAKVVNSV